MQIRYNVPEIDVIRDWAQNQVNPEVYYCLLFNQDGTPYTQTAQLATMLAQCRENWAAPLIQATGLLVEMYWHQDFISCITPGARQDAKAKPHCQATFDAWDTARDALAIMKEENMENQELRAKLTQTVFKAQTETKQRGEQPPAVLISEAPTDPEKKAAWAHQMIRIQVAIWMDDGFKCCECGYQPKSVDEFLGQDWRRSHFEWTPETAFVCESCWPAYLKKYKLEEKYMAKKEQK